MSDSTNEPDVRRPAIARVFFALWPDASAARRLAGLARALRGEFGGRSMHRETLHLTLVFVGEVPERAMPELLGIGAAVAEGFLIPSGQEQLRVDRLGWWPHNRIVWAAPVTPPPILGGLAERLLAAVQATGWYAGSQGFVPHITLLRGVRPAPGVADLAARLPPEAPPAWIWNRLLLVRSRLSEKGAAYETIGAWPLRIGG